MKTAPSSQNQTNNELRNRFDLKTLILVMTVILLATVIILWNPDIDTKYHEDRASTLTAQVVTLQRPGFKSTPYPVEILDYPQQTNGIILGSVVILLIIIGGSLSVIQRKD
jgi:hypothetical protein